MGEGLTGVWERYMYIVSLGTSLGSELRADMGMHTTILNTSEYANISVNLNE